MEKTLQTDAFWESNAPTTNGMSPNYSVRRIGGNVKTTNIILELIVGGHIIQTTQIAIINYCDITEEHLLIEGPNARTLGVWKDIHWPYWSGLLEEASLAPSLTMPIVVETFALVSK
jgi:hypothetical protein